MKKTIKPELGSGFRDYLPEDMIPRQKMLDTIRVVFERYGFAPLDTPGIEREEILTGGDENFKKQIFKVGHQRGEEKFALRFDLTVPLARVVAANGSKFIKPFRRYQSGKVWRGERPQAGRYREFLQFDADIVGTDSLLADAEVISLIYTTLKELGFNKFTVRVNNRKILNALPAIAGFKESLLADISRILDKLDKISWSGVSKELVDKLKINDDQVNFIKDFVELSTKNISTEQILEDLEKLMSEKSASNDGVHELKQLTSYLKSYGIPDSNWRIDTSIARGLGYYTGIVFETVLDDLPDIGSVFSGGRYNELVSSFGIQQVSAVGASIGVDRLFAAMDSLGMIKRDVSTPTKALIVTIDGSSEKYALEILATLRQANIASEMYIGKETQMGGKIAYALKKRIPAIVILGENEQKALTAKIKILKSQEQISVSCEQLVSLIKRHI